MSMTKVSQQLKTDKRTKSLIKADVLKTKVLLTYNNFVINLKQVDAKKIAKVLSDAIAIQESVRADRMKALTPTFLKVNKN